MCRLNALPDSKATGDSNILCNPDIKILHFEKKNIFSQFIHVVFCLVRYSDFYSRIVFGIVCLKTFQIFLSLQTEGYYNSFVCTLNICGFKIIKVEKCVVLQASLYRRQQQQPRRRLAQQRARLHHLAAEEHPQGNSIVKIT